MGLLQQLIQFFGGAFGVTVIGLLLESNQGESLNIFWTGSGGMFSNAFLLLQMVAGIASVSLWLLHRALKPKGEISNGNNRTDLS